MAIRRSLVVGVRWVLAVAVCAFTGHVALYRAVVPNDGTHAYLAWYAPAVAALSVAAVLTLMLAAGVRLLASHGRLARMLAVIFPASRACRSGRAVGFLSVSAFGLLVAQESLERSLQAGGLTIATFNTASLPLLLTVLVVSGAALIAVERTVTVLVTTSVAPCALRNRRLARSLPPVTVVAVLRTQPMAQHAALRGPPLGA